MSKLKKRSVLQDKNPIYTVRLTQGEFDVVLKSQGNERFIMYTMFPGLEKMTWWRIGRTISWRKGVR